MLVAVAILVLGAWVPWYLAAQGACYRARSGGPDVQWSVWPVDRLRRRLRWVKAAAFISVAANALIIVLEVGLLSGAVMGPALGPGWSEAAAVVLRIGYLWPFAVVVYLGANATLVPLVRPLLRQYRDDCRYEDQLVRLMATVEAVSMLQAGLFLLLALRWALNAQIL